MDKLKVGVIGAGFFAEKHLEVLTALEDVEVAALCSRGHPRIHALAERFKIERTFAGMDEMFDELSLDAVFVLVNVTRMVEVTSACLRRGVPTLLEKPPGLCAADARSLRDLAAANDCLNMVGLNRRFYSVMRRAREAILEVGPMVSVLIEAPERLWEYKTGAHPPEVVKGLLFANGIHSIDLLRYFGGDVKAAHAFSSQWDEEQKNSFGALMRFESGAMGQYIANWMSPGGWSVTLYGMGRRVLLKPLERGVMINASGAETELEVDEVDKLYKPGLHAQDRYFLDCVREGRKVSYPAADLAEAVKTMELIEVIAEGDFS
jgi:predicted dehydrogenase